MAMSFAVVHMQKIKTAGLKGIQFHNQRERESKTNKDIIKEKTHLNYDLKNDTHIDFNKRVEEIIKNEVQTERAIRKDAVKMCNFVVTSDKSYLTSLGDKELNRYFEESYDFFKDRYGEAKIVSAIVHHDEYNPHMHLSLVPITEDHKLSAKRLFDRRELRSIQEDYPKHMQSRGFAVIRGVDAEGVNKHIETQELKLKTINTKVSNLDSVEVDWLEIDRVIPKPIPLSKSKGSVDIEEFDKIKDKAQLVPYLKNQILQLQEQMSLSDNEPKQLRKRIIELNSEVKSLSSDNDQWKYQKNIIGRFLKSEGYKNSDIKEFIEKENEKLKETEEVKDVEKPIEQDVQLER